MSPSENHRRHAGAFTSRVQGVPDGGWDQPAPVEGWVAQREAVQALLDDPATADLVLSNPHLGEVSLPADPETCRRLYEGMLPMDVVLRASGQYGPRVPVPDDSDPQNLLLAFIGRRP